MASSRRHAQIATSKVCVCHWLWILKILIASIRLFSRLQKENIISVDGREVVINDHDRLNEICHKAR